MSLAIKLAARQLLLNRKRTAITLLGVILASAMITATAGFAVSMRETLRKVYIASNGDWHVAVMGITKEQAEGILGDSRVASGSIETGTSDEAGISDGAGTSGGAKTSVETETSGGAETSVNVYFRLKEPTRQYERAAAELASCHGVTDAVYRYNTELLGVEGIVASDQTAVMFYGVALVGILVIVAGSVLVISNAFAISANERMRQFGILKSVGATGRQVRNMVLSEGAALALAGIPLGFALGFAVESAALSISNNLLVGITSRAVGGRAQLEFQLAYSWTAAAVSAVVSFVTILLSAWGPSRRAGKVSAIEAIRLSGEVRAVAEKPAARKKAPEDPVRITARAVRTSKLIPKLFGFEGTLAAKALKISRRLYRATVVSIVVGIVLYIVSSSFGEYLIKAADMLYPDYGADVAAFFTGDIEETETLNARITAEGGPRADIRSTHILTFGRNSGSGVLIPEDMTAGGLPGNQTGGTGTPGGAETLGGVITLDKDWFGEVRAEAGVSADKMTDNRALLINYREANEKGRMVEYKPYRFRGQSVTLVNAEGAETELKLAGEITAPPASLLAAAQSAGLYEDMVLVVSPEAFNRLAKGNEISAAWFALTANAEALAEVWRDIDGLEVINISEAMSVTRNINALIMLFIYGFIGMLSLIGVTSVIGAISTNISLRVQEFALLAAVGMTPRGRRRMLNLESLFYGVKALCIGVPVGLAVSYLMYMLLSAKFGFAYTVPWFSILVSIAAVFAIVFATMRYAGAKVGSASIVESMRNMNI